MKTSARIGSLALTLNVLAIITSAALRTHAFVRAQTQHLRGAEVVERQFGGRRRCPPRTCTAALAMTGKKQGCTLYLKGQSRGCWLPGPLMKTSALILGGIGGDLGLFSSLMLMAVSTVANAKRY